jgi:hypothetical protein
MVQGLGSRVLGLRFICDGSGSRVQALGCRIQYVGSGVKDAGI